MRCPGVAPPHHATAELGWGEMLRARSHEEREQCIAVGGEVHDRRRREQEHLRAHAKRRGMVIASRGPRAQMVRFVDDHEVRHGARTAAAQRLEAHERDRHGSAIGRRAPLLPERRRCEHEHATRPVRCCERNNGLSRAGRIGEQRAAELVERGADRAESAPLHRPQGEGAEVRGGCALQDERCDPCADFRCGHPPFQSSSGATTTGSMPYASHATRVSNASLGGAPAAPPRPSGASSARARGQSAGSGRRAQVQPR